MSGDITPYTSRITSEHATAPKFMATVAASCQPFADTTALLQSIPGLYDVDAAVGAQLDTVGLWVGATRTLQTPLVGVYFSFDTAGVGFDQGSWQGPFDPTTGLVSLSDTAYRTLIRATIASNQWDGSIPTAYAVYAIVFGALEAEIELGDSMGDILGDSSGGVISDTGFSNTGLLIQDYGDMSMLFALTGEVPDAVTLALLTTGKIALKPAGVHIDGYMVPSVAAAPYFGFDAENASVSGFDGGAWGTKL